MVGLIVVTGDLIVTIKAIVDAVEPIVMITMIAVSS
jgi:hypothetical protein